MERHKSSQLQIVLVEDNSADVRLVQMALNNTGLHYELHVMDDGEKAMAFIEARDACPQTGPIDLLLLDLNLPKYEGEEILKRLRSTDHYAQTPVVIMTSSDASRDHDQAKKHAAMHYFRKPSTLAEFMQLGEIVRDLLVTKSSAATGDRTTRVNNRAKE